MSGHYQSHSDSSSGDHECLSNILVSMYKVNVKIVDGISGNSDPPVVLHSNQTHQILIHMQYFSGVPTA